MMRMWIVEDEGGLSQGLARAFERDGYAVRVLDRLGEVRGALAQERPDVVLLDIRLPDGDGLSALPHLLREAPEARVVVMTAFGDSSLVVRAIREGAWNYLDKPFPLEAARNMVSRAVESLELSRRVARLRGESLSLVGSSAAMERVRAFVAKVAPFRDLNVLLVGESGVGKEVVARMLHAASGVRGDFVALNCAAVPEALLESELFGYRRGAYTGAGQDKEGLAETAAQGTLFLDEIGDMPLVLQGKMLRFLETRTLRPLGSTKEIRLSLQVMAATCVDLERRVADGTFRRDLYFRIAMLPLVIPPLRDREGDVRELLESFLKEFALKLNRPCLQVTPEVEEALRHYAWPGNVRELRNLVERLYILRDREDGLVRLGDLPEEMLEPLPQESLEGIREGGLVQRLDDYERRLLREALEEAGGNRTRAASALGISRFALLRRLQRHALE